jgi:hypothetical protein
MTITRIGLIRILLVACLFTAGAISQEPQVDRDVCSEIVTTLIPQRVLKIPTNLEQFAT